MRTPCIIESPWAGCVPLNRAYLEACIRDSISRGETPYASHKMLTDALDDLNPEERKTGIQAGLDLRQQLIEKCGAVVAYYTDLGWSSGMKAAAQTPAPDTRDRLIAPELWSFVFTFVKERHSSYRDKFFWEIVRGRSKELSTKDALIEARALFLDQVKP